MQSVSDRVYAAMMAYICWGALALQIWLAISTGRSNGQTTAEILTNYFSFFTILMNIFAALMFTATALTPSGPRQGVRTAAAVYIAVGGLACSFLLRQVLAPQGLQKIADILLHHAIPLAYVLFWFIFYRKRAALAWRSAFAWLIWPLAYLIYSLVRGSRTGWYPYLFLDHRPAGYSPVFNRIGAFILAFLLLGVAAVWLTRGDSQTAPLD